MDSTRIILSVSLAVVSFTLGYFTRRTRSLVVDKAYDDDDLSKDELKIVMVVNTDLKMGKGKIGAQCGHAAVGAVRKGQRSNLNRLNEYLLDGQKKVCLKAPGTQFHELASKCESLGLQTYVVRDAGRTQIPSGSMTVLAIGPAPGILIDQVTGDLKLL
eukprot:GHVH01000588.1.p1 GENE.GHVH01000588.1~~GHVH01000588.1.p1  ORF type:complete len:167 (+),score=13.62 GHVH01000588.1:27-503(+)